MAKNKGKLLDGPLFEQQFKNGEKRDYGEIVFHKDVEWTGGDRKEVEDRVRQALGSTKGYTSEFVLSFGKARLESVSDTIDARKRVVTGELLAWHEGATRKSIGKKIKLENKEDMDTYLVQCSERDFISLLDGSEDRHSDLERIGTTLLGAWSGIEKDRSELFTIDVSREIALTVAWLVNLKGRLSEQKYQKVFSQMSSLLTLSLVEMEYTFTPNETDELLVKLVNCFAQSKLFPSRESPDVDLPVNDIALPLSEPPT